MGGGALGLCRKSEAVAEGNTTWEEEAPAYVVKKKQGPKEIRHGRVEDPAYVVKKFLGGGIQGASYNGRTTTKDAFVGYAGSAVHPI